MDIHYFIAKKHLKFSGFAGFHSRVGWPGFWKSKLVNWPANVDFEGVGWGPPSTARVVYSGSSDLVGCDSPVGNGSGYQEAWTP